MKKLLVVLLLTMLGTANALDPFAVNRSSAILGAAGTGYIASGYLDVVMIGAASAGGVLELYNSTFTTNGFISSVTLTTVGYLDFKNLAVQGIFWRIASNAAGVSIIYKSR